MLTVEFLRFSVILKLKNIGLDMKEELFKMIESEEKYQLTPSGKEISCALVIQNPEGEILGCHSTGKKWGPGTFDLPKGHQDVGERPLDTAIRECIEETGLDFSDRKDDIVDLGVVDYTEAKVLHIFYIASEIPDVKTLHCDSTFTDPYGRQRPEVNGFVKIGFSKRDLFFKSIQKALELVSL